MPLLFTMSLCGSIGTLFYIVVCPLAKKYLSVQWRRYYLICNILQYLIPFPYFHTKYRGLLKAAWSVRLPFRSDEEALYIDYTANVVQIAPHRIYILDWIVYILIAGVIMVGSVMFCRQIYRYWKIKYFLKNNAEEITDQEDIRVIQESIFSHRLIKYLRVYQHKGVDTPFVIGVICPIIVFPCKKWTVAELEMAMSHEIIHIYQRDNLIKILAIAALALNFYNPLVWYVLYQWNLIAELSCDYKVIAGRTKEEIKQYGMLIIEMAENQPESVALPLMGFNVQNKMMKERINQMTKETKKDNLIKKVLGASIMGVALFSSSLSVLAYSPKSVVHSEEIADQIMISDDSVGIWGEDTYTNLPVNEDGGWVVFTEDGEIIEELNELNLDSGAETYMFCNHNYESCKVTKHIKYSDNSCKLEYCEGQKCSKCGNLKVGDLISTITYSPCPH